MSTFTTITSDLGIGATPEQLAHIEAIIRDLALDTLEQEIVVDSIDDAFYVTAEDGVHFHSRSKWELEGGRQWAIDISAAFPDQEVTFNAEWDTRDDDEQGEWRLVFKGGERYREYEAQTVELVAGTHVPADSQALLDIRDLVVNAQRLGSTMMPISQLLVILAARRLL